MSDDFNWKKKIAENKELFDKWEAKLKDSGFRDIEYRIDGEPADYMVGPNPMDFVRAGARRIESASSYYEAARQYRWWLRSQGEEDFNAIRVWDLHSEGKSIMAIVKAMGLKRWFVTQTIKRIKADMMSRVRAHEEPFNDE